MQIVPDALPDYATQFEALKAKMVTLKLLNIEVRQKIVDEVNRIGLAKRHLAHMKKNVHYIYPTSKEVDADDTLDPFIDYINFSYEIYDKTVTQPELFDALHIDAFSNRTKDHKLSQDQINTMNELLDTAIENANKNQASIEESFKNEDFEKIVKTVEEKRKDLETHIQSLADIVAQLEMKPRDEVIINGLRTKEVAEIADISDEMHELVFEEFQKPSNTLIAVHKAIEQMADIQKALIKSTILA